MGGGGLQQDFSCETTGGHVLLVAVPITGEWRACIGCMYDMSTYVCMTGAQDDLRRVTDMADRQIKQLGMNDAVGNLSFSADSNGLQPYSQRLQHIMDMVRAVCTAAACLSVLAHHIHVMASLL